MKLDMIREQRATKI